MSACDWTADGAAPEAAQPTFTQQKIQAFAINALAEVAVFLIINGNGTGRCKGILQTAGITSVARTGGANTIRDDNLTDLEQAISPMIRSQCIYVIADTAVTYLKKLTDGNQRPLYPELRGSRPMLRGYPVVATRITKLGAAGDVLFGWPGAYICALESDLVIAFSDDIKFTSGLRVYRATMAVGGWRRRNE